MRKSMPRPKTLMWMPDLEVAQEPPPPVICQTPDRAKAALPARAARKQKALLLQRAHGVSEKLAYELVDKNLS